MQDGGKVPDEIPLKNRLLWWLSAYFGFQAPLVMWFPFVLNYPWGLAPYFAAVNGSHNEAPFRTAGYLFYAVHFLLTVAVSSRRIFTFLMLILVVVLSLNTSSCIKTLGPKWYMGLPKIEGQISLDRPALVRS